MKARQIVLLGLTVAMASIPALAENAGTFSALGPSEHIDVPCDTSELINAINTANSDDEGYTLNLAAGTMRVKDIYAGGGSSEPGGLTNVNGTLFFGADDGSSGDELWKSDGTAAGTVRVKDIEPSSGGSYPYGLTNVNGTLFFGAYDGSGAELWKSDGTEEGTVRVRDICPGPDGSEPYDLTDVNGTLFFNADDASSGSELWKSDGTEAGTVRVKDIYPGRSGSSPYDLTNVNGTLFFGAYDGSGKRELWKSDGTEAGTVRVKDVNPDPGIGSKSPMDLTEVNGTLFFSGGDSSSGGWELWKSDGTEAGTVQVKDINPGPDGSEPYGLTNVNGTLFFSAYDGSSGHELWKSDGTEAGTVQVKDVNPGTGSSSPYYMTNVNGTLFFSADDGSSGRELWRSDGTAAGCTYTLTEVNNDIDGPNGLPSITSAITINGNGATIERSATAPDLRILHVATGGDLTLNALAITGGRISGNGRAIYNANGTVTLVNSTVSNNMVGDSVGGGVYNAGILHSINSTIDGNTAAQGGGIYNTGMVNLSNTAVISNAGVAGTGSGGIFNTDVGSITLTHSIVSGNTANNACAGIFSSGTMVLASTVISGNSGTGIVNGCGGIENHGNLTVSHSTIRDNVGTNEGGGIRNGPSGNLTLVNSTISGNAAYKGGGIDNLGTVTLSDSIVTDNSASQGAGGGIHNMDGAVELTNCTISGNRSGLHSGGGGIYTSGTMTLTNCTVSDNEAYSDGGGIDTDHGTLSLKSSIVATNRIEGSGQSSDCAGTIISLGYNLDSDGTCNLTDPTDLPKVDPLLGPLQDNGGPTWTRALLPGSPAIDRAGSSCPPTDQRGALRPQDGDGDGTALCDIGAYEVGPLILNVRAFIDGRSRLIVRGDTAYWHHYDFAAPGRHFDAPGGNVPTFLNGAEWCPSWRGDPPDLEPCAPVNNQLPWCDCDSSSYVGIPILSAKSQTVGLEVIQARYRVYIVDQPDQGNGYTFIVEFDDDPLGGPDWYEINLTYQEEPAAIGRIVVNNDEWPLSDYGFAQTPADAAQFARNVASWFTGGQPGNFLVYSTPFGATSGLVGSRLADTMADAGHTWTIISTTTSFSLDDLLEYDGIFLAGSKVDDIEPPPVDPPSTELLISYVQAGGNVYLAGGTDPFGVDNPDAPADEAAQWNPFLNACGLEFEPVQNTFNGTFRLATPSSHPILAGVQSFYQSGGNSINQLDPGNPSAAILVQSRDGEGLYAVCTIGAPIEGAPVTAIDLLSFTAQAGTDHATLAWETGTEVDNAGFNLWRSEAAGGPYAKINDALIPAEGDAVSGASYTYVDADVIEGVTYYYRLEDVDIHGASTFHGPVSARPGRPHLTYLPIVLR